MLAPGSMSEANSAKIFGVSEGACDERTSADGVIPVGANGVAGVTVALHLRNRHDRHVVRGSCARGNVWLQYGCRRTMS